MPKINKIDDPSHIKRPGYVILVPGLMERNEAVEFIEATEAVEVIEAAKVSHAKKSLIM